jgi:antitoxin component YwqK of YwqJK toxin-antitoxin module
MKSLSITFILLFYTVNLPAQDTLYINNSTWIGKLHNQNRDGYWKEFRNDSLISKGKFKNDVKDGKWEYFGSINQMGDAGLIAKGFYNNGQKVGEWTYSDGSIDWKGKYLHDLKQGIWLFYERESEDHKLIVRGNFIDGLAEGKWEKFNEDGSNSANGIMRQSQLSGIWQIFHSDGTKACTGRLAANSDTIPLDFDFWRFSNELNRVEQDCEALYPTYDKTDKWVYYYNDTLISSIGYYKNGRKEGDWKLYHFNGKIQYEGSYQNGEKEGPWKEYYDNGNIKCNETYLNGSLNDSCSFYSNDGSLLMTGHFTNGNRSSEWKSFSKDGIVVMKGNYDGLPDNPIPDRPSNGFRCGLELSKYEVEVILNSSSSYYLPISNRKGCWEKYSVNGSLEEKGEYVNGKKEGEWKNYHDGNLTSIFNYKNDLKDGKFVEFNWQWKYVWRQGVYKNGIKISEHQYKEAEGPTKEDYFIKEGYKALSK